MCVCSIHQNSKLMVDVLRTEMNHSIRARKTEKEKELVESRRQPDEEEVTKYEETYKDLMNYIVCNMESLECMVHRCEKCPGRNALQSHLETMLIGNGFDNEDMISFTQWESTDRTVLRTFTTSVEDFIENLVCKIDNLTTHSFIARSQSQYLKERKESIDKSSCIILLDFAENYNFIAQDEIQGYHWNKDQITLHPVVIYYKDDKDTLQHYSLCFLSDDLDHDTTFVYEVQRQLVEILKERQPHIRNIEYFSDGCVAHYKNYKNFMNLCFHREDFGLTATWAFFATSHGKSPCDEIGGTIKRKIGRASLQRPTHDQMLTFDAVVKYCNEASSEIVFCTILKEDMLSFREKMKERYKYGSTVPGTRSCHFFEPTEPYKIRAKFVAVDPVFSVMHSFEHPLQFIRADTIKSLKPMDYITCIYDNFWWLALVEEINKEEKDVTCKFMTPHGLSEQFRWPNKDDFAYVPFTSILEKVSTPNIISSSGRNFSISSEDMTKTRQAFEKFLQS